MYIYEVKKNNISSGMVVTRFYLDLNMIFKYWVQF